MNTMKKGYVYIMSNKNRNVFYVGLTNNIERRIFEHRTGKGSKFCKKYLIEELLYFEETENMISAIAREKNLKNWHRDWKLNLIKEVNPEMVDLAKDWFAEVVWERKWE